MPHLKTILVSGLTTAAFVAIIFRVKAIRTAVTGLA